MRRVLVTGGGGFIGRTLCTALLKGGGSRISVVGRGSRPAELDRRLDYIRVDLLNENEMRSIFERRSFETLVHLAWETRHGLFWTAPENELWIAATVQLVHAFAEAGGRRVVATGTCVEYQPPEAGPCVVGRTMIGPIHPYGIAKDTARATLERDCAELGLSFCWPRLFMLIGPGEHPSRLVPSVARHLLEGKPALCGSGRQVRDFIDVRDAGAALAALAGSSLDGAVNLCSGEPVSIATVVQTIGERLGRRDLIRLGAIPDRAQEPVNLWGDGTPLLVATSYTPRYTLTDTLDAAIAYWRGRT